MKFGDVPLNEAVGAILAHSVTVESGRLKKGRVLDQDDVAALRTAGHEAVVAARLEPGEVVEDEAASLIAQACLGENLELRAPFTGRCNLTATAPGLAVLDPERVNRMNQVNEAVTFATVPPFQPVDAGQLAATVKIITFAVHEDVIEACRKIAAEAGAIVRIAPFRPMRVGLLQTRLPGLKESLMDKAVAVTRDRLTAVGSTLDAEIRCPHTVDSVAEGLRRLCGQGCDVVLVLGASAIVDRRDVVPAAIEQAGGAVEHFGMPVDPGNLMLLAHCGETRVLGLPGSARSPRLHGFDWVLQRIVAGVPVSGEDLMHMGVGGLLKEIPSRPMPRDQGRRPAPENEMKTPHVGAVIMAAGQSRRMGEVNKLLADIDGAPMVTHVADAVLASRARPVVIVTGHESEHIQGALAGRNVEFVDNPDYAAGLSTSLKRGLGALPEDIDGAVVCLGDMPNVTAAHVDRLIEAFAPDEGRSICVPTFNGKRGNPVLWARRYFVEMAEEVAGDVGARHLIGAHPGSVCEIPMPDSGVLLDLDTPQALAAHMAGRKTGA